MKSLLGSLVCVAAWSGCGGSDPADVTGTYGVGITNRANGCQFQNWEENAMTPGISVVVAQDDSTATADVQGGAGFVLDVAIGGHVFEGEVDGNHLDLAIMGTRANTQGNCTFTYDATLSANLVGDALMGTISYTAAHNNHSDCAAIECVSTQEFSGSRPPR
jgi:hypothetical protein